MLEATHYLLENILKNYHNIIVAKKPNHLIEIV